MKIAITPKAAGLHLLDTLGTTRGILENSMPIVKSSKSRHVSRLFLEDKQGQAMDINNPAGTHTDLV